MRFQTIAIFVSILNFKFCSYCVIINSNCEIESFDSNESLWDHFDRNEQLGKGTRGTVYRYTSRKYPHCQYAVKESLHWLPYFRYFGNEVEILKELNGNPYFPRYYGYFEEKIDGKGIELLFMEHIKGQNLSDWINSVKVLSCLLFRINSLRLKLIQFLLK